MELGIFTALYSDKPLEEVAPYVASLGYRAVELAAWLGSSHLDIDQVVSDSGYARRIRQTLERSDLKISALANHQESQMVLGPLDSTTDEFAPCPEPEAKIKFATERTIQAARAAAILEVPVVTGFVGSHVWNHWYSWPPLNEKIYEEGWGLLAERWNPILDAFRREGVRFAHEVSPPEIAYNLETAERCLQAMDNRPEFGFNFDPSHFVWQGIDPVVVIKHFGPRIYHVHAKDAEVQADEVRRSGVLPGGSWTRADRGVRFRVPGWGNIEWRRLITALLEVGYNGVLSFEHEDPVLSREDGCEQCARALLPIMIKEPLRQWGIWWGQPTGEPQETTHGQGTQRHLCASNPAAYRPGRGVTMWNIGVNTQIWVSGFGAEDTELIGKAASMGFDEIEMSFGPTQERPFPTAEVRAALRDTGLRSTLCGALTADMDITSGEEKHATAALKFFEHALSTAADIGAEVLCGPLYAPLFRRRMLPSEARAQERHNAAKVLTRVGALAEQAGVRVALEPLNRYETDLINVVEDGLKVVEEADSPFVGLHLDTFHMNIEERDSAAAVAQAGSHVMHVHISESDRGVPGTGQVHWADIRASLADIGYAGLIVVEGFNPAVPVLATNANIWREFAADADEYARASQTFMRDFAKAAAG